MVQLVDFHMHDASTTSTPATDGDDKSSSWERCSWSGGEPLSAGESSGTFSRGAAVLLVRGGGVLLARGEGHRSGRRTERQSIIAERMVSVMLLMIIVLVMRVMHVLVLLLTTQYPCAAATRSPKRCSSTNSATLALLLRGRVPWQAQGSARQH